MEKTWPTGAREEKIMTQETNQNEVVVQNNAVAKRNDGSNYITAILEETKQGFVEANNGLDMDFVRMGEWLTVTKKGNFVEKDDENVSYGDNIDVVIGYGEQRWSVWGLEESPEAGQLIVAERTKEEAEIVLNQWLAENPQAQERYELDAIQLRYMASVVPVSTLSPDDFPRIYLMSFSPTDTIIFGRFAMNVYTGKYKALEIPSKLGVNRIVTRLVTAERKSRTNASNQWIGIDFQPVGVFKPEDYGINVEETEQAEQASE
ncbi:hypothetical protein BK718_17030 [Bacillus thuringiensis serovar andalousiensis]|uniref:Phage protein n=2 Tax=Bacillus TaxID=1386 RepID=A0A9X6Q3X7_BACTU|nr:hypothetical protein BK718_17030 [Bacillus thuringiensis serovar andalousiensis]OTZ11949.1 hypothetical protein BK759_35275 [Bacillus thuringiensis serovar aizawai]OUA04311.1 hypothetical protein BK774_10555 [Bacillus thuringiensis]